MIYLVSAIGLILASNAIAVFVIENADVASYVDIGEICHLLGEPSTQCAAHGAYAGWIGCISAVVLVILVIAANRRFATSAGSRRVAGAAFVASAPLVVIVTALYVLGEARNPLPLRREDAFLWYSTAISLGNLIWPLFLQLAIISSNWKWRLFFLCLVSLIVAFSPFRGVFFAVGVFGVLLPLLEHVIAQIKAYGLKSRQVAIYAGVFSICAAVAALQLAIDTKGRPSNLAGGRSAEFAAKLGQRVAIPLFQAHLARAYDFDPRMPTLADDLLTKLRLRRALDFNSYLFAATHEGVALGEVTSLYFGEAAVRTTSDPIVWSVAAPLLLVLIWVVLRKLEVDASLLIGLAIWRGSLGGLIGVMPALAIQLGLYVALCRLLGQKGSDEN
jgi:hypothetical protein